MAGGRPQIYTQELADRVCAELAEGKSLRTVCKADDLPCTETIFSWLRKYPEFLGQYTRAKEESADAFIEEMHDISDSEPATIIDDKGVKRYDSAGVNWQRLRVDTRKWIASKLKPKKYGDKVEQTVTLNKAPIELTEEELANIASTGRAGVAPAKKSAKQPD